ncbi:MAG: hypothetical protein JXQ71_02095 [Verrucomicrobia bacterium]|nr:hypothetical protein [Verrucomicrobiota bacterium]
MNPTNPPTRGDARDAFSRMSGSPLMPPLAAGVVSWMAISLGFLGLKMLMQERPEFAGRPTRGTKAELVQEAPLSVARKATDDLSAVKPLQPDFSDVRFDLKGRRDYRGLRMISDMAAEFWGRYALTNASDEPMFVLFKCPHPRTTDGSGHGLLAGGLKLQASAAGVQENAKDAWYWSGVLERRGGVVIDVSYQAAALKGVTYRVGERYGNPVRQHRVTFQRRDLAAMRFESGDGMRPSSENTVVWERRDFLAPDFFTADIAESRSVYVSLTQLLEMGPVVCLLFLLAVLAVILARQRLTAVQALTIAAGYAFYFPLVLYLSSRFSFATALVIAVVVPGALLVNYGRWLVGTRLGLVGGPVFLGLYQVFPTLAAFAGWNRGMVLLCLGVITLGVLINLQNQTLKALQRSAATAVLAVMAAAGEQARADGVQVLVPGELAAGLIHPGRDVTNALIAFDPAQYRVCHETGFFQVQVRVHFEVIRPGDLPVALFSVPVHLRSFGLDASETDIARLVTITNRPGLFLGRSGQGMLRLSYRVAVETREGRRRAQIPLLIGPPGRVRLESPRADLDIVRGGCWGKTTVPAADGATVYDLGVAGEEFLEVGWRLEDGESPWGAGGRPGGPGEFYGIGLIRAQHLTVIHSDGSCTHFAECDLPLFQAEEFQMRLPAGARLISASVNGHEISSPLLEEPICRVRLPAHEAEQTVHRLSFRIAYPPMRLGFVGVAELELPEVFQTAGTLEWVVALPHGVEAQVMSSGLETQKAPPDLSRFGDYGRILKPQPLTSLAKSLAPPGPVSLNLKYRQRVPFLDDAP